MLIHIREEEPQPRQIKTVAEVLSAGGVVIYPTDTIYGLGCDIFHLKAIDKICKIKNIDPAKAHLSFVCHDLSDLSEYATQLSNSTYRLLKDYLPGPYTFILPASRQVPKMLKTRKNTIGLRVPDNKIARNIARELNHPILSTSLPGQLAEEFTDPEMIYRNF